MAMKDILKTVMKDPRKYFSELLYTQTLGSLIKGGSEVDKSFFEINYDFKKNLAKLLLKCLRPQLEKGNKLSGLKEIFNLKSWQEPKGIENLMQHAETLHQAISYLETLKVLAKQANKDDSRKELFDRYQQLCLPRLSGIYTDWRIYK